MRFHPARLIGVALLVVGLLLLFDSLSLTPSRILHLAIGESARFLGRSGVVGAGSPGPEESPPRPDTSGAFLSSRKRGDRAPDLRYEPFFPSMLASRESLTEQDRALEPALRDLREWESQAASDLDRGEDSLRRLQIEGRLDAREWETVGQSLDRAEPFLGGVRRAWTQGTFPVVGLPDAPDEGSGEDRAVGETGIADVIESASRLLCLRAGDLMRLGNFAQAMSALGEAADVARLSSNATIAVQKAQVDGMNQVADTCAALLRGEQDPRRLMSALREVTSIEQKWEQAAQRVPDPVARDLLARVAAFRQSGVEIDPQRLAPDELYAQLDAAKRDRIERLGERMQQDEDLRGRAEQRIDSEMAEVRDMVEVALDYRQDEKAAQDSGTSAPLNPFRAPESAVKAKLDVLRLDTAARLYRRDGATDTTPDPERLSPRYLPASPTDPFTREPYRVDAGTGDYYSLGPDRADDHARIPYDPTNGALSRGDIYLNPKK